MRRSFLISLSVMAHFCMFASESERKKDVYQEASNPFLIDHRKVISLPLSQVLLKIIEEYAWNPLEYYEMDPLSVPALDVSKVTGIMVKDALLYLVVKMQSAVRSKKQEWAHFPYIKLITPQHWSGIIHSFTLISRAGAKSTDQAMALGLNSSGIALVHLSGNRFEEYLLYGYGSPIYNMIGLTPKHIAFLSRASLYHIRIVSEDSGQKGLDYAACRTHERQCGLMLMSENECISWGERSITRWNTVDVYHWKMLKQATFASDKNIFFVRDNIKGIKTADGNVLLCCKSKDKSMSVIWRLFNSKTLEIVGDTSLVFPESDIITGYENPFDPEATTIVRLAQRGNESQLFLHTNGLPYQLVECDYSAFF